MTNLNGIIKDCLNGGFDVQSKQPELDLSIDLNSMPCNLRDYQVEAVESIINALEEPGVRICLVLPTGGGKTRVANFAILKWMESL